jgi:hypothetical protein
VGLIFAGGCGSREGVFGWVVAFARAFDVGVGGDVGLRVAVVRGEMDVSDVGGGILDFGKGIAVAVAGRGGNSLYEEGRGSGRAA